MTSVTVSDFCARYDASKPKLPYSVGSKFSFRSHCPKPPNREYDRCLPYNPEGCKLRKSQHPVVGCKVYPPAKGNKDDHPYQIEAQITEIIRVKDKSSAQLVVIKILSISGRDEAKQPIRVGSHCVAKFYDPLYNHHQDSADPFLMADSHYQHEVAAYHLLKDLQGEVIPTFHGSYTITVPTSFDESMLGDALHLRAEKRAKIKSHGSCDRKVRCILIERIKGTILNKVPHDIPKEKSKALMKAIIDAESRIFKRNVRHNDLFARNIIVTDLHHERPKVVIIDFGHAAVGYRGPEDADEEEDKEWLPGVYISPLLRYHKTKFNAESAPGDFEHWVKWDWQSWLEHTYKDELKLITPEMRSVYLSDWILNRYGMTWKTKL